MQVKMKPQFEYMLFVSCSLTCIIPTNLFLGEFKGYFALKP